MTEDGFKFEIGAIVINENTNGYNFSEFSPVIFYIRSPTFIVYQVKRLPVFMEAVHFLYLRHVRKSEPIEISGYCQALLTQFPFYCDCNAISAWQDAFTSLSMVFILLRTLICWLESPLHSEKKLIYRITGVFSRGRLIDGAFIKKFLFKAISY